jgi:hypothetical protein
MDERKIPIPAELRQSFVELRANLARHQIVPVHTIESYPIGRRDRGQCRLEVEYKPGKGFRRIKTTTDKQGQWCNPKKSIWDGYPNYVITGELEMGRTAAWLQVSPQRIAFMFPNNQTAVLLCSPSPFGKPRREAETVVFRKVTLTFGPGPQKESRDEVVMPADPPELCDAYDAWIECFGEFRREYERLYNPIVNQRELVAV